MELFLALIALAALIPLAGVLYQWAGRVRDARRFLPPGRLVEIGGGRLHLFSEGAGSPVVVFEAGIAATSLSWRLVQPQIARLTQTVGYDRAWLGWSDAIQAPRDLGTIVEELRTLLDRACVAGPRILVAHSFGGLVARAYAARYPAEIAGMVLVDPVAAAEWADPSEPHRRALRRGILLSRRGALLARAGVVRSALSLLAAGAKSVPKLVARASAGRGAVFTERIVGQIGKLPREVWPMIQSQWSDSKSFEGMARYLEALPASAAAVMSDACPAPLIVLSAENSSPVQRAEHERLAAASPFGRIEIVRGSGHWIQLDRPDAVIRATVEMVERIRG